MVGEPATTIVPNQKDIDAWRLEAETAIRFGGVHRLGQFNWPQAVLSLIAAADEIEQLRGALRRIETEQAVPFPQTIDGPLRRDGRIAAIVRAALREKDIANG